jgi:hypothetical protein
MVFLHGTSIMHGSAVGQQRTARVRQVQSKDPTVLDYASCVPTEGAVAKVTAWQTRGAEICYLSSHRTPSAAAIDQAVIAAHGFPAGTLYYRAHGESYADLVRRWSADVLIEDDCESIGGCVRTTASELARSSGRGVPCVVVPEFGGLTDLPDDPAELLREQPRRASWSRLKRNSRAWSPNGDRAAGNGVSKGPESYGRITVRRWGIERSNRQGLRSSQPSGKRFPNAARKANSEQAMSEPLTRPFAVSAYRDGQGSHEEGNATAR